MHSFTDVDIKKNELESLAKMVHENNYKAAMKVNEMYERSRLNTHENGLRVDERGCVNVFTAFALSLIISNIEFRFDKYLLQQDPQSKQTPLLPASFFTDDNQESDILVQSFVDLPVTFTLLHIFYLLAISKDKKAFTESLNIIMNDFFARSCIKLQFNFGEKINDILRLFCMHSNVSMNVFYTTITCDDEHKAMIKREIELFKESIEDSLNSNFLFNRDSHAEVNQSLFTKVKFIVEQKDNEQLSFIIDSATDFNSEHKISIHHKTNKGNFSNNRGQYSVSYPELNSSLITKNDDKALNKKLILAYKETQNSDINVHFQDKTSSYYYKLSISKIEDKSSDILPQSVNIMRKIEYMQYTAIDKLKNTKTVTLNSLDSFDNKQFPITQDSKNHIVIPYTFAFAAPTTMQISKIIITSHNTTTNKKVHDSSLEFKMESLPGKGVDQIKKIKDHILYNNTDYYKDINKIESHNIKELKTLADDCSFLCIKPQLRRTSSTASLFLRDNIEIGLGTFKRTFSINAKKDVESVEEYWSNDHTNIPKRINEPVIEETQLNDYSTIDECILPSSSKNTFDKCGNPISGHMYDLSQKIINNEEDNFESASGSSDKSLPQTTMQEIIVNNHQSQSNALASAAVNK